MKNRFKCKGFGYFLKNHRRVYWDRWHYANYFYQAPPR